ncbi:MAG: RluA family pseudouridine synthase [Enhygromyxa sp.]
MPKAPPKRFRVIPQEQGLTLRNLLVRRVRELDRESATKLIRAGGVYVNKLRVRLPQVLVAPGERVTVYVEALDAQPLDPERLSFIHRDPDFVVLDKPAGVPVSPVRETAVGCLSEALIHSLEAEGVARPYVGVVHRLDRGASGLVLFTIRSVANKSLHKQFVEHSIRRGYRIRVRPGPDHGAPPAEFSCDRPLVKLREGGVAITDPGASGAMTALTHFRHVAELPPLSGAGLAEHLLDVELETGRTHQIRAHAAHLGFPVVGDRRYGEPTTAEQTDEQADADEPAKLCLHAWTLDFAHPRTGEALHFEAPLPDWAQVPAVYR